MKHIFRSAALLALALPALAAAQATSNIPSGINTNAIAPYANGITYVINYILVPVLMAIAFIVFLWGVYKAYIYKADSDTERAKGHQFVLWGVVGFVVILSLWGLVNLVGSTLGLTFGGTAPRTPTIGNSLPGGTTGASTFGGPGGNAGAGSNITQTARTELQQSYAAYNAACSQDPSSAQCQQATRDYTSLYNSVMGTNIQNGSLPPSVYCPNGSVVYDVSECSSAATPSVYCPDGSVVSDVSQCPSSAGTEANPYGDDGYTP